MWARASTLRLLESPQSPDTFSLYTLIRCRQGGGEGAHRHGAHIAAGELHSNRPAQTGCASQGWWSGKLRGSFEGPLSNVPHEGVSRACARTDRPTKRCRRGRWRRPRRRRCRREPAPGRLRQGARGKTEVSTAPAVATCRVQAACLRLDPTDSTDPSPRNTRHSSPPHPPPASVRARAAGPRLGRAPHACESSVQGADNVAYGGLRGQLRDSGRSRVAIG